MTDKLTTADLAGGTANRTDEHDAPMGSSFDTTEDTRRDDARMDAVDSSFGRADTDDRDFERDERATATASQATRIPNPAATDGATKDTHATPLFPANEVEGFRSRWMEVQTGFVDEPRSAVEQADSMVAEMMKRLAQVFADERSKLEEQWSRGDDISTEDLRVALQRYRSFFDRLLSV